MPLAHPRHGRPRNRIRAGCYEGLARGGEVTEELIEHHRRLPAGGIAMTTLGYLAVSFDGRGFANELWARPEILPQLRKGATALIPWISAGESGRATGLRLTWRAGRRNLELMARHGVSWRGPAAVGLLLAVSLEVGGCATARIGQHGYCTRVTAGASTGDVRYLLYLPADYGRDARRVWPLIVFLHGSGERGSDLELLKRHPLPETLETDSDFPFIVVSPQLPGGLTWDTQGEVLDALLSQLQARYAVDPRRLYLTGLSLGGAGAWAFGMEHPERFAAIVPIAGFYHLGSKEVPPNIAALRDVPIWVFHGAADISVPLYQSEILVEALLALGGNVRFTVYEGAGHEDAWRKAYADPALFEWMAAQSLE